VVVALPGGEPLAGTVVKLAPHNEAVVALDDGTRLVVVVRPGPAPGTSNVLVEAYAWGITDDTRAANQARVDAAAAALAPSTLVPSTASQEAPVPDSHVPAGNHAVTPYICCDGAADAIDFYVEAFGATESGSRFVDGSGRVGHAELRFGDSVVYLSDPHPDIGVVAPDPAGASVGLLLYVPDVDDAVSRAEARGARVVQAIEETFYGTRRATVVDPFGHRWLVGTHVRDVSDDEYQAAVEGFAET
jgi:PhnB protein